MSTKKLNSGLTIISIDHYQIEGIIQRKAPKPIEETLWAHKMDTLDPKTQTLPPAITEILKWYKYEKILKKRETKGFCWYMAISPILGFGFYLQEPSILFLIFLHRLSIGFM